MVKIFSRKSFLLSLAPFSKDSGTSIISNIFTQRKFRNYFLVIAPAVSASLVASIVFNTQVVVTPKTYYSNAQHIMAASQPATQEQHAQLNIKPSRHSEKSALRNLSSGHWKAGLAAFGKKDMNLAAENFCAVLKDNDKLPASDRAAAAFWAYRAFLENGDQESARHYLELAANENTDFYSIIARHINGKSTVTPGAQMNMAVGYATKKANVADSYPMPNWTPTSGYKIEPALLYAIMRQESYFNPDAESASGAIGVMQLMPDTAHAMARNISLSGSIGEPAVSMALGQQYIRRLMDVNSIGDNLVFLLAAYNAGPGAVEKWQNNMDNKNDPLLFIESIPYGDTRDYVVNVIGNYWVYSELFGDANFSLSMIAQGEWPLYTSSVRKLASDQNLIGIN